MRSDPKPVLAAILTVVVAFVSVSERSFSQDATRASKQRGKRSNTPPPTKPPLIEADASQLPEPAKRLDVYLLMGQSNMKGRGVMPEEPLNDPRIINMHLRDDQWYLARHPLHLVGDAKTFKGHDNAGVGPGLTFAQEMLSANPDARIGLVPCAVGGSAIARWVKDGQLYNRAIARAREALEDGPEGATAIRGAIWLQGEADARPGRIEVYPELLSGMIRDLRADLNVPDLPFVACTIGEMRANSEMQGRMNRILLDLPQRTEKTACVDARDQRSHIGDSVHFDTAAQEEMGRRFAKLMLTLQAN